MSSFPVADAAFAAVQKTGAFVQAVVATPPEPAWFGAADTKEKRHKNEGKSKD